MLPGGRGRLPLIRPVTMFSAVLVVLALLLAPYVRPWVNQRSQIAEADEQTRRLRQEVKDLTAQRKRWDDPAFVRAQARERLHFVMPGETGYVVLDDARANLTTPDPRSATAVLPVTGFAADTGNPWYAKVWNSIRIAGDPTTEQARSAAEPVPGEQQPASAPPRPVVAVTPGATPAATPRATARPTRVTVRTTPRASVRTTASPVTGANP
jgi:cell division protein FtsB